MRDVGLKKVIDWRHELLGLMTFNGNSRVRVPCGLRSRDAEVIINDAERAVGPNSADGISLLENLDFGKLLLGQKVSTSR